MMVFSTLETKIHFLLKIGVNTFIDFDKECFMDEPDTCARLCLYTDDAGSFVELCSHLFELKLTMTMGVCVLLFASLISANSIPTARTSLMAEHTQFEKYVLRPQQRSREYLDGK